MEELYDFVLDIEERTNNKNYFEATLKELEDIGELITVTTISSIIVICLCATLFITTTILSFKALKRANKNKNKFLKILEREKLINQNREEQND